jgi:hypothetical protein
MKIISHRGNLDGPNPERENTLKYIDEALSHGYDAEIDLRVKHGILYLGHDGPDHHIAQTDLDDRRQRLWIHYKDNVALSYYSGGRAFCHQSDPFSMVMNCPWISSKNGFIWVHDLSLELTNYSVIPLISKEDIDNFDLARARCIYGICTDYPNYLKEQLSDQ